jgi:hypothetical protein
MDVNKLIAHYQGNYSHKVFLTKLSDATQNAYIMYIHDYSQELESFSDTFLKYLPFYVRNSDYFEVIDESGDIDSQLANRSKSMRKNSRVIPQRRIESDGIYGELFLDFYLRIINARNAIMTYANKRSFDSNFESTGPDNIVYYVDANGNINICICEAKFVGGASNAKGALIEDIVGRPATPGKKDGKPAHVSATYLNDYFQFVVEKGYHIQEPDKSKFKLFFEELNAQLDSGNDFVSILIKHNVCVNLIFFAIFDSTRRTPDKLKDYYDEIYSQCEKNVKIIGFNNYKIEIVFVPTENQTMDIKRAMEKSYE